MKIQVKPVKLNNRQIYSFADIRRNAKFYQPECIYKDTDPDSDIYLIVNHNGEIFCIYDRDETTISIAKPVSEFSNSEYEIFKGTLEFKIRN